MKKFLALVLASLMMVALLAACGAPAKPAESSAAPAVSSAAPAESSAAASPSESASASASPSAAAKGPFKIIFVNALVGHPVYNQQDEGVKAAAEALGKDVVDVQIVGSSDTSALAEKTVEIIDQAIAMKPDAMVCEPWDASINAALQRAKDAGIPVACTSNMPPEDLMFAFIGTDNTQYGITAAETLAEKTGGKANVMIMMSKLDISNQVEAKDAFEKTIKEKYPDMKVVLVDSDDANLQTATEKFDAAFRAYKEIDTVLMLEGTGAKAAAAVAKEQNRKITVLGIDATEETLDGIKKGDIWGTLAQNFYKRGYESIRYCVEYLQGHTDTFNKINDSGLVLVTKDNADSVLADLDKATRKVGTPLK
jgi:ABC-type sugar transport system substrate-binding protein